MTLKDILFIATYFKDNNKNNNWVSKPLNINFWQGNIFFNKKISCLNQKIIFSTRTNINFFIKHFFELTNVNENNTFFVRKKLYLNNIFLINAIKKNYVYETILKNFLLKKTEIQCFYQLLKKYLYKSIYYFKKYFYIFGNAIKNEIFLNITKNAGYLKNKINLHYFLFKKNYLITLINNKKILNLSGGIGINTIAVLGLLKKRNKLSRVLVNSKSFVIVKNIFLLYYLYELSFKTSIYYAGICLKIKKTINSIKKARFMPQTLNSFSQKSVENKLIIGNNSMLLYENQVINYLNCFYSSVTKKKSNFSQNFNVIISKENIEKFNNIYHLNKFLLLKITPISQLSYYAIIIIERQLVNSLIALNFAPSLQSSWIFCYYSVPSINGKHFRSIYTILKLFDELELPERFALSILSKQGYNYYQWKQPSNILKFFFFEIKNNYVYSNFKKLIITLGFLKSAHRNIGLYYEYPHPILRHYPLSQLIFNNVPRAGNKIYTNSGFSYFNKFKFQLFEFIYFY